MSNPNKIQINKVDIGYELKNHEKLLLSNLNISAEKGEIIALIGVNGSGKSTLLRTLAKLQNLLSGNILIDHKNLQSFSSSDIAKKIAFVSSEIIKTRYLKVKDLIGLGRFPHQKYSTKYTEIDKQIIEESLNITNTKHLEDKNINEISDGERQKVMIARALAQDTDIMLLDEPTVFLDISNKYDVYSILERTCKEQNKTIIYSTHDLNIALKHADKVWLIKDKSIMEGAPEDLMLSNQFSKIFDNQKVKFNNKTSLFEVQTSEIFPIKIIDHSKSKNHFSLTINALKRKGFYQTDDKTDLILSINPDNTWVLKNDQDSYEFDSIYNLMKKLSFLNFK